MNLCVKELENVLKVSPMVMGGASVDSDLPLKKKRTIHPDEVFWQAPHVLHEWSNADLAMECSH